MPGLRRDQGLGAEGGRCRRECADRRRQTSVTAGTVTHRSHLPLRTWFPAAHLMATHSNGISALQLQAQLGIGSYRSAWLLPRKLRRAMVDPDRSPLQGIAEVDGASMPCRDGGGERGVAGRGRGAAGRIPVAGAVELSEDGSPRRIRLETVGDYGAEALHGFIAGAVEPGAWTVTDGWSGYTGLPDSPRGRRVVGGRPAHEVLRWIHRVFPDLRRWAMGVYHGLRRKRAQRHLDGSVFRWTAAATGGPPSTGFWASACRPRPHRPGRLTPADPRPDSAPARGADPQSPRIPILPAPDGPPRGGGGPDSAGIRETGRQTAGTTCCGAVVKGISLNAQ